MTAEELQTLLKAHAPRIDPNAEAPKLPDMLWSRLYRSLSAYLFERSGVIDFFHGQLKEAVGKRYLQEGNGRDSSATHLVLANYFEAQPRSERQVQELPWQLQEGRAWSQLAMLLSDLNFLNELNRADNHAPQAYWAVVEMQSPHKAFYAYREVLENPRADLKRTLLVINLISYLGYSVEASVSAESVADGLNEIGRADLATDLLLAQAGWRCTSGHYEQALELVDKAMRFYNQAGDRRGMVSSLRERVSLLRLLGRQPELAACLDECESICREVGDFRTMAECIVERAVLLNDEGRPDEALEILVEAERTAREFADRSLLINCLTVRAIIAVERGSNREALELFAESERLCRALGESLRLTIHLMGQARLLGISKATREEAIEKCREAQAIFIASNREVELYEARLLEASLRSGVSGIGGLAPPLRLAISSLMSLVVIAMGVALGLWNRWLWLLGAPLVLIGASNLIVGRFSPTPAGGDLGFYPALVLDLRQFLQWRPRKLE